MGLRKKRDYVDLSELKRRGILKVPEIRKNATITKEGFVDFTQNQEKTNTLSFLDNFATSTTASNTDNLSSIVNKNDDFNALKIKIDDLEYKLERLIERLEKIEGNLEK